MFSLKNIIFSLFGVVEPIDDINKDLDGKGLSQRFNELIAGDLDDNEISLINLLVENTVNPWTCFDSFIPYHEGAVSMPVFTPTIPKRRKFRALIREINRRRGTRWGYIYLFRMLGFNDAVVEQLVPVSGFDSPGTFDDPDRVFDERCRGCSNYNIQLTGTMGITEDIIKGVLAVISYNEPIDADLMRVTYNGDPLINGFEVSIYIDSNGDLIFVNPFDITFTAWLTSDGDIVFSSDYSSFYSINADGDLILTT